MRFLNLIVYMVIFIYGAVIGSFLNVIIYRIPVGISIFKGRSICPSCNIKIRDDDLVPILSYIRLRGKCRNCNHKISTRYPLIELFTGFIAILTFYNEGFNVQSIIIFIIASILIVIALIDVDTMTIPNKLLISLIPVAIIYFLLQNGINFIAILTGFFSISLPMYILNIFIEDSFGGGDIKLVAICGAMIGWENALVSAVIAIFIAGAYSSYLLISKKTKLGTRISFGPYLCLGTYISLLYGNKIINGYISLLNI